MNIAGGTNSLQGWFLRFPVAKVQKGAKIARSGKIGSRKFLLNVKSYDLLFAIAAPGSLYIRVLRQ